MTNAITDIDLGVLHDAIERDIRAAFPQLRTVEFYRSDRKELPTPACLLELTEMEGLPDDDPGTEQQAVMAQFTAELIIGWRETDEGKAKLVIRKLAGALAAWLRLRKWTNYSGTTPKLPTGAAQVIGAYQDDFAALGRQRSQDLEQFEVWRVEFQFRVHLGNTVFDNEEFPPPEVWTGQAPEIGTGHEDDYDKVYPK